MTTIPSKERLTQYTVDFTTVLHAFQAVTDKILVMSPVLLGEAPMNQNPRDHILNTFLNVTEHECKRHNVTYFNLRSDLLMNIPSTFTDWQFNGLKRGYWTRDGEHFNERGMNRVVEIYKLQLEKWFPPVTDYEEKHEHKHEGGDGDFII